MLLTSSLFSIYIAGINVYWFQLKLHNIQVFELQSYGLSCPTGHHEDN